MKKNSIMLLGSILMSLYLPNDVLANCAAGSIIAGNGVCYEAELPEGISPVGVVFDSTNRLAIALTWWFTSKYFSETGYDTDITNCTATDNPNSCAADGRANTNVMLKATQGGTYHAAQEVNQYEPTGCTAAFCKKTKWFIPSIKEWRTFYQNNAKVMLTLSKLMPYGADAFYYNSGIASGILSSNEYSKDSVYLFKITSGGVEITSKTSGGFVRPIVKY